MLQMTITFKGAQLTLCGSPLHAGDRMPGFVLIDQDLKEVDSRKLSGTRIFLTVPSLDTGVCDQEVRRFNQAAADLPGVSIYAVSLDLPFAQSRWCGAAGVNAVRTLSDYRDHSFGRSTATRIYVLGLLTRAVFVVDAGNKIAYAEYVPEVTNHPDYDAALSAVKKLIGRPS